MKIRWSLSLVSLTVAAVCIRGAQATADDWRLTLFLGAVVAGVTLSLVPIERGRLSLGTIPLQTAAILLNPRDALVVAAIAGAASMISLRGRIGMLAGRVYWTCVPDLLRVTVGQQMSEAGQIALVIGSFTFANSAIVGLLLAEERGEPIVDIWKRTFTKGWVIILAYFAVAVVLMIRVLDGTLAGYVFATAVVVLSLPLTDTVAARRTQNLLLQQLTDADRHLLFSQAFEGLAHNLRNHLATIQGHLEELSSYLPAAHRSQVAVAQAATEDAIEDMNRLSSGASPSLARTDDPIDLIAIAQQSTLLAQPHARRSRIQLTLEDVRRPLLVRGDPLMLREVVTNLLLNAIDASEVGAKVSVTCGMRGDGYFIRVADNGPGVSDAHRKRLFEPHFTTKPNGTGMGLFMSYGIVREHQGRLLYEGSKRGAVFTMVLPPAVAAEARRERLSQPV